jgi:hypothetical protein
LAFWAFEYTPDFKFVHLPRLPLKTRQPAKSVPHTPWSQLMAAGQGKDDFQIYQKIIVMKGVSR